MKGSHYVVSYTSASSAWSDTNPILFSLRFYSFPKRSTIAFAQGKLTKSKLALIMDSLMSRSLFTLLSGF